MLKNMKIGVKLVLVGTIIIIVPLLVVAVIAISRATSGLTVVENEQLAGRSQEIAQMIDRVFAEEQKAALSYSIDDDVVAAAQAVAEKPAVPVAQPAAKPGKVVVASGSSTADLVNRVDAKLKKISSTKGIGDSYQVIMVVGLDGVAFAASDPAYLGVNFSDRGYVKTALAGTVNAGSAARNKVTGKPFAPFAAPIRAGDKVVGAFALIADISFLNDIIAGEKIGTTGYAFVTDNTGLVIAHPKTENIFTLDISKLAGMETLTKRMISGASGIESYVYQGVPKTAGFAPVKATGWSVALTLPDAEYLAAATDVRNLIIIISVAALVLAFLIYLVFSRTITKPLARGVAFAQLVAGGDFTQQLDIHQKDEIGALADSLNGMSVKLRDMVATIQDSAEQVSSSSEQITASAQKLAEGAQSQASTLEETSASVEELTASVDQVAEHAQSPGGSGGGRLQLDGSRCTSRSRTCRRISPRLRVLRASRWTTRWREPRRCPRWWTAST